MALSRERNFLWGKTSDRASRAQPAVLVTQLRGFDPSPLPCVVRRNHRWAPPARRGRISQVTSRPVAGQHLRDLARLRRVRDRIDREYAQPLDVEALARGAHMSAGHLSRQFRLAYGESPYGYLMTRRIERAMALAAATWRPRVTSCVAKQVTRPIRN